MQALIKDQNLEAGGFLTPKDLENKLFKLNDDEIIAITGFLPDTNAITHLDYSVLNEVIGHVMKLPLGRAASKIEFPDWDEKIKFNKLSPITQAYLNIGAQKLGALNEYLSNQSFLADELQEKITAIYLVAKAIDWGTSDDEYPGDLVFWDLVKSCAPRNEVHLESAIITIIAKYFETCDVFEKHPDKI